MKTITALGDSLDSLYEGLIQGESGLSRVTRFDTSVYLSPWAGLIRDLPVKRKNVQPIL